MPAYLTILINLIPLFFGLVIGSFLNVCIYRIPKHEDIVVTGSHCMSCGYRLKWYDMVPVFSYLVLGGKCRKCGDRISIQYPAIEALNGLLYLITFLVKGISIDTLLYCFLFSCLIVLSVIDFRTYEIPLGVNICILALGLIRLGIHYQDWLEHVIGLFAVSVILWLIYQISKGTAVGGGDVKLMAAAGLMLGWKLILLAFCVGYIFAALFSVKQLKLPKEDRKPVAMGPFLSLGIVFSVFLGQIFINWYLGICGF